MIEIYDSYTKTYKEVTNENINMYVCGITTSDFCHLGHAFSSVSFEILDRFLTSKGFKVTRVQNFTDVDDKIITKSISENLTPEEVSEKYINAFFEDMDALGVKRANSYPKATDEIGNIISFIESYNSLLNTNNLNHSMINSLIKILIKNFSHRDLGKNLDQKM